MSPRRAFPAFYFVLSHSGPSPRAPQRPVLPAARRRNALSVQRLGDLAKTLALGLQGLDQRQDSERRRGLLSRFRAEPYCLARTNKELRSLQLSYHGGLGRPDSRTLITNDRREACSRLGRGAGSQDARHTLVADPEALRLHRLGDGPQGLSLPAQRDHFPDGLLLGRDLDQLARFAPPEPKWDLSTEIPPARFLIGFYLPDPLADAVALGLGERGGDRQKQLGQAVAGNVAAEVEEMQAHASRLQFLNDLERVESRPEQAIELRGDHHVALRQLGEQRAGGGTLGDRDGAADALLDHDVVERQAVHEGITLDLAPLHVEAFALGGLLRVETRQYPKVAISTPRQLVSLRLIMTRRDSFVNLL